jgi:hypothetical protein
MKALSRASYSLSSLDYSSGVYALALGAAFAYFSLKLNLMKALSKASYSLSSLDYSAGVYALALGVALLYFSLKLNL